MTLSHLNEDGEIHMVDITAKPKSKRRARARAVLQFPDTILRQILEKGVPKGDLFSTARLAGIQGAKRTPELIPLAHPIQITHVSVEFERNQNDDRLLITSEVHARDATGVEMEALTAVNTAALTFYDMCKSEHKGIQISNVRLLRKEGGSSGTWVSSDE